MTPDDLKRAGVRVRSLDWLPVTMPTHVEAGCALGEYVVVGCAWFGPHTRSNMEVSFDAAKAAAQQHYEDRILSALEPIHE